MKLSKAILPNLLAMRLLKNFESTTDRTSRCFAFNDEMAIGVYKYVAETNYQMGKDIRIIGFDNSELGAFVQPRLATIAYSKHRWGMVAAEKIIHLMREKLLRANTFTHVL